MTEDCMRYLSLGSMLSCSDPSSGRERRKYHHCFIGVIDVAYILNQLTSVIKDLYVMLFKDFTAGTVDI